MKNAFFYCLIFILGFVSLINGNEINLLRTKIQKVEELALEAREKYHLPGLAIAVVSQGKPVFQKGYGLRDIENELPVTPETVFAIGSMTKAFTTFTLATLVQEGKIAWDDKVISHLPDFRLKDDYVTRNLTIRDLVTHQSGLPRHDLVWYLTEESSADLYLKLQHLEPVTGFREKFNYQNLMYMVAGKIIEKTTSEKWENVTTKRVITPLEMTQTSFSIPDLIASKEYALPYVDEEKSFKNIPYHSLSNVSPAGCINSTILDLSNWMQVLLGFGQFGEKNILSTPHAKELMTPQTLASLFLSRFPESNDEFFEAYGLGWFIQSFRGHYLVSHGGGIDGFTSNLAFLPLDNLAVVVLTNKGTMTPYHLTKAILDVFLEVEEEKIWLEEETLPDVNELEKETFPAKEGTSPSHLLDQYSGVYENPGYGKLEITYIDGELKGEYQGIPLELSHLHYDIFKAKGITSIFPLNISLSFEGDLYGNIKQVTVPFQLEGHDVTFVKCVKSSLFDLDYLKTFAGTYSIETIEIELFIEADKLKALVPGQPVYELIPKARESFSIKGYDNIRFQFEMANPLTVEAVKIIQPQGTFKAIRIN